jgi:hypothetical protein
MAMPWQLKYAKRPKRAEPRPLVEQLPRIDIGDLVRLKLFPDNWHTRRTYELSLRYPFLRTIAFSFANIEVAHNSGYNQRIGLRWIRTGFGGRSRPRPLLICRCSRSVRKLYLLGGSLGCRRCCNAIHASQACSREKRPALQAQRLQTFLRLKAYMRQHNRQRIQARLRSLAAPATQLTSKRLSADAIQLPCTNYNTRGPMLWC